MFRTGERGRRGRASHSGLSVDLRLSPPLCCPPFFFFFLSFGRHRDLRVSAVVRLKTHPRPWRTQDLHAPLHGRRQANESTEKERNTGGQKADFHRFCLTLRVVCELSIKEHAGATSAHKRARITFPGASRGAWLRQRCSCLCPLPLRLDRYKSFIFCFVSFAGRWTYLEYLVHWVEDFKYRQSVVGRMIGGPYLTA